MRRRPVPSDAPPRAFVEFTEMTRQMKTMVLIATGCTLLQFGGCLSNVLKEVFFAVGPFLL